MHPLDDAIILEPDDDGTLLGEPGDLLQRAVDAGVLYVCRINDGTCPEGRHTGGVFLHYCRGKTPTDYDDIIDV